VALAANSLKVMNALYMLNILQLVKNLPSDVECAVMLIRFRRRYIFVLA
jgi:hypothetical protein